jgi:glucokinase
MAQSAREALDAGEPAPVLASIAAAIAPAQLEAIHVAQAAEAGDPVAERILERARRAFSASVVSIVNVFNPDRVIVGGGIAMAWGGRLLDPAREAVATTAFRLPAQRVRIVPATLGDDVGLIGTVALVASALQPRAGSGDDQSRITFAAVEGAP